MWARSGVNAVGRWAGAAWRLYERVAITGRSDELCMYSSGYDNEWGGAQVE